MRSMNKWLVGSGLALGVAGLLSPALGGNGPAVTFSLLDAEGVPGGTAGVALSLSGDDGSAVSAGVDIVYPDGDLTFQEPVASSCVLDDRISSTHQIAGRILSPGTVNVEISVLGAPDPLPPLDNGVLAVCDFSISGDAMVDDEFPVDATNVLVGDELGAEIDSNVEGGVVRVVGDDTPTPTSTATPTNTPMVEPTEIPCDDDSDCPTGTTCQNGSCMPQPCDSDEDCPPGSDCGIVDGTTSGGGGDVCIPRPCEMDDDCADPSAVCDDDGLCRPEFCDDENPCSDPDEICGDEGYCIIEPPECEADSDCPDGVCVDEMCVECRDNTTCPAGQQCNDNNQCEDIPDEFSLDVGNASGLAGTTVSVEVTLAGPSSAETVTNDLAAGAGLTLTGCTASDGISGTFEGLPGTTASASLSGGVPTGVVYSCSVLIAEGAAAGTAAIECPAATANGSSIDCDGGEVNVQVPPTPTPTESPTQMPTPTQIPPTDTPTPRMSLDDDGCAVAPAPSASTASGNFLLLLAPAMLLWRRRRS